MNKIHLWLIACLITFSSCATILSGTKQKISVKDGTPAGADVFFKGTYIGAAPVKVKVPNGAKDSYINIQKEGYETQTIQLTRKARAGYIVLDVLCGLLPLAVDVADGAIYKQYPKRINYKLTPAQVKSNADKL